MKILHLREIITLAGFALALLSCQVSNHDKYDTYTLPTRSELIHNAEVRPLSVIADLAIEHLKVFGILAGEDVDAIMFDLDVNMTKRSDDELVTATTKMTTEAVGALYYFVFDREAAERARPKFYGLMKRNKRENWPAVIATKRDGGC